MRTVMFLNSRDLLALLAHAACLFVQMQVFEGAELRQDLPILVICEVL